MSFCGTFKGGDIKATRRSGSNAFQSLGAMTEKRNPNKNLNSTYPSTVICYYLATIININQHSLQCWKITPLFLSYAMGQ